MNRKNIKGFTLIEVVVAMFIFVMVISASVAAFASMFRSYRDAKDIQENIENSQYAMNIMAKTFRTSSVLSSDSTSTPTVEVFDYSQDRCFRYDFSGDALFRNSGNPSTSGDPDSCPSLSQGTNAITSGQITGRFSVEASDDTVSSENVGKITVSMTITKGVNSVNLQTTTSLRDYVKSGISL